MKQILSKVNNLFNSHISFLKAINPVSHFLKSVNSWHYPVSLLHFKGKKQTGRIILDWGTANELRTDRFEIEKSNDGSVFKKIGAVAAIGYSNVSKFYEFADVEPLSALNYYRLKMIDADGKFTYSNVVVFFGDQPGKIIINKIKPNPFTGLINVDIVLPHPQHLSIQVVDMTGKVGASKDYTGKEGDNSYTLNGLNNLPAGIYFVKIVTEAGIVQQKVLKIN